MILRKIIERIRGENIGIGNFSLIELLFVFCQKFKNLLYGNFRYGLIKFKVGFFFIEPSAILNFTSKIQFTKMVNIGKNVKINALGSKGFIIGKNFSIRDYSIIDSFGSIKRDSGKLIIGSNVGFSEFTYISVRGNVTIGDDVIFGPGCKVFTENHGMKNEGVPFRLLEESRNDVSIGNNVWIGSGVTILPGTNIGNNSIIAAGSVVTKNIDSNTLYAGIPAKPLKKLN